MLISFVVFLLAGCIPIRTDPVTKQYVFEARNYQNKESVHLIRRKAIDIVELTNSRFKMLVFYEGVWLEMMLIVPAGEELFVKESFVKLFDTTTQQELYKFDLKWFHVDSQLDDDTGRLIGLMSSPPATKYKALNSILHGDLAKANEIFLKLPIFRTKGNETIIFDDVTFKIWSNNKEYKGRYQYVPLCCS
jgi:hypothetical protein